MKFPRRGFLHLAAGAAALPIVSSIARAQAYPARTITLIVPFPPGGSTDVAARIAADHMSRTLGQQVIVQNVSGAGGTTGSIRAMRADPDGYTILMGQMGTHAASVALYPNLAYKPDADFAPIGLVTAFPLVIAARTARSTRRMPVSGRSSRPPGGLPNPVQDRLPARQRPAAGGGRRRPRALGLS
jgi:putative tricarboxylic transport membrane protein